MLNNTLRNQGAQVAAGTARQSDAVQLPNMRDILMYRECKKEALDTLYEITETKMTQKEEANKLADFYNSRIYLVYIAWKDHLIDKGIFNN